MHRTIARGCRGDRRQAPVDSSEHRCASAMTIDAPGATPNDARFVDTTEGSQLEKKRRLEVHRSGRVLQIRRRPRNVTKIPARDGPDWRVYKANRRVDLCERIIYRPVHGAPLYD
ncbi:hypothetical protein MRX96_025285 [Rhipicephalus microplus]